MLPSTVNERRIPIDFAAEFRDGCGRWEAGWLRDMLMLHGLKPTRVDLYRLMRAKGHRAADAWRWARRAA